MDAFKTCTGPCGRTKPLSSFHKDNRSPDGLRNICKVCRMQEGKANKRQSAGTPRASSAPPPQLFADATLGAQDGAPDARQPGATDDSDELVVEGPDEDGGGPGASGGLFADIMGAMKGAGQPNAPKEPKSVRDEREATAEQLAVFASYGVSLGAAFAIPNPYKPIGPQYNHAHAIIKPLAEIIAEKMELSGHLTPTMARLAESATGLLMYADYAFRMYLTIRAQEAISATSPHNAAPSAPSAAGPLSAAPLYGGPGTTASGGSVLTLQARRQTRGADPTRPRDRAARDRQNGAGAGVAGTSHPANRAEQAASMAQLYADDLEGNQRLGHVR